MPRHIWVNQSRIWFSEKGLPRWSLILFCKSPPSRKSFGLASGIGVLTVTVVHDDAEFALLGLEDLDEVDDVGVADIPHDVDLSFQ